MEAKTLVNHVIWLSKEKNAEKEISGENEIKRESRRESLFSKINQLTLHSKFMVHSTKTCFVHHETRQVRLKEFLSTMQQCWWGFIHEKSETYVCASFAAWLKSVRANNYYFDYLKSTTSKFTAKRKYLRTEKKIIVVLKLPKVTFLV